MQADQILGKLRQHGVAVLPEYVVGRQLVAMQEVFNQALQYPSWNTWQGYEQNEKWRLLVENLLIFHRAFYDLALDRVVNDVMRQYVGSDFQLTEARGWSTLR